MPHTLCEGIYNFMEPILIADEDYVCNKCRKIRSVRILDLFEQPIASLDKTVTQGGVDDFQANTNTNPTNHNFSE